jgi:hypothetical protein
MRSHRRPSSAHDETIRASSSASRSLRLASARSRSSIPGKRPSCPGPQRRVATTSRLSGVGTRKMACRTELSTGATHHGNAPGPSATIVRVSGWASRSSRTRANLPHRDRPFEEIDGTRNGPSLIHRQARERGTGGAGPQAVLTYLMPVKVIDLQIPFAGEQTRQRRLSRLRTASDPQHVREPLTRIVHEPGMMRRNVYEKQSSANALGGAQ